MIITAVYKPLEEWLLPMTSVAFIAFAPAMFPRVYKPLEEWLPERS